MTLAHGQHLRLELEETSVNAEGVIYAGNERCDSDSRRALWKPTVPRLIITPFGVTLNGVTREAYEPAT